MDMDITIGCALLVTAVIVLTVLTMWARRVISHIGRNGYQSTQETLKELKRGI